MNARDEPLGHDSEEIVLGRVVSYVKAAVNSKSRDCLDKHRNYCGFSNPGTLGQDTKFLHDLGIDIPTKGRTAEEDVLNQKMAELFLSAFKETLEQDMPPMQRDVLAAHFFDDQPTRVIWEKLQARNPNLRINTVSKRLSDGRENLIKKVYKRVARTANAIVQDESQQEVFQEWMNQLRRALETAPPPERRF